MRLFAGETLRRGLDRKLVPERAEADDAAHSDIREIRVVAKLLASEGVREMQFDEGQLHAQEGIAQGDAGVRETARIQDGEADAIGARGLHAVDELVFGVALEGDQFVAKLLGRVLGALLDGREGVRAIDLGLTGAQKVEIWTIQ